MSSFEETYAEWQRLVEVAAMTRTSHALRAAEQARIAVAHHPSANQARGWHEAAVQAHRGEDRRSGLR